LRLRTMWDLAQDRALVSVSEAIFRERAFPHACCIFRAVFPGVGEQIRPPHQDFRYVGGTPRTWTAWIPVGDCHGDVGGLAIAIGSHASGLLPVRKVGNRGEAVLPDNQPWAVGDLSCGDVLMFSSLTAHRSMPNLSEAGLRLF